MLLLLASASPAEAAEERWLETEGTATLAGDISMDRAQAAALATARRRAVEGWAGVTIEDSAYSVRSQTGLLDLFRETRSVASGRIVREEILRWETVAVPVGPKEPPITRLTVRLRAEVARDEVGDPAFHVGLSLDRDAFYEGDALTLQVKATEACYPLIFNLAADGKVYQIYPNAYRPLERLEINAPLVLPGAGAPFKLTPRPLPGHGVDVEAIKVVALRHPVVPPEAKAGSLGLAGLYRWLVAIPAGERAEATTEYRVLASKRVPTP
ncbi:MAG: hypothetical protein JWM80_6475 [Cyanobacteria bacterium RYN_339]|nr:hypothetical protein [Cyanobacteria bacterium RYN_339]